MPTDRSTSFHLKLEADVKDIRSAMDKVMGDLSKLKRSFSDWSTSATKNINSVTEAMQKLSAETGRAGAPAGFGGLGGTGRPGPSVGGGAAAAGGGFGSSRGGGGSAGTLLAAGGGAFVGAALASLLTRGASFVLHFGMQQLRQSLQMARQYEYSALAAYGAPGMGRRAGGGNLLGQAGAFGVPYGMNAAQALPVMARIRQGLAPSLTRRGELVGWGRAPEGLAGILGYGSGAGIDAAAQALMAAQFGGTVNREGRFPEALSRAPGVTIAGYAGALTTFGRRDGVSAFNMVLQDLVPTMDALNNIMRQSVTIQTQLNEESLKFATLGVGLLRGWGRSPEVAQTIVGQAISGMANPGGGDAGRALAYRAVGYRLGMDPIEAQRRLESGDIDVAVALFREIRRDVGGAGYDREVAAIQSIFQQQYVHQADLLHKLLGTMAEGGALPAELQAEAQRLIQGGFAPFAAVEAGAAGQMQISPVIAGIENLQITVGQGLEDLVTELYNFQAAMLGKMEEWIPDILQGIRDMVQTLQDVGEYVSTGGAPPGTSDLREEIAAEVASAGGDLSEEQREVITERVLAGRISQERLATHGQSNLTTHLENLFFRGHGIEPKPGDTTEQTVAREVQRVSEINARRRRQAQMPRTPGPVTGQVAQKAGGVSGVDGKDDYPDASAHFWLGQIDAKLGNLPRVLANPKMYD